MKYFSFNFDGKFKYNWNFDGKFKWKIFKWKSARKIWLVDFIISALPGCPSLLLDDRDYSVFFMVSLDGCLIDGLFNRKFQWNFNVMYNWYVQWDDQCDGKFH